MADSIIFDLDGTLWDSTAAVFRSWKEVARNYPQVKKQFTLEDLKSVMGLQIERIAEILFPGVNEATRKQIMNDCCESENRYIETHGGELYDGLEETLAKLSKSYRLFIVSNCQDGYIEAFFKAHKLQGFFSDYECPGRTGLTKGENIQLIIDRNKLENPVFVGDTQGDADAAAVSNIPFIYASYGFGSVLHPDLVIDSLTGLEEVLSRL